LMCFCHLCRKLWLMSFCNLYCKLWLMCFCNLYCKLWLMCFCHLCRRGFSDIENHPFVPTYWLINIWSDILALEALLKARSPELDFMKEQLLGALGWCAVSSC
jgi:hypothetical protein